MEPQGFKSAAAQRRSWRIQRVAWVVLWTVLLFALAGGLGAGPLSQKTALGPAGLELRYQRIWRVDKSEVLELTLPADSGEVYVELPTELFSRVRLERITPEPTATILGSQYHRFVFTLRAGEPVPLSLELAPQRIGRVHVAIGAGGGQEAVGAPLAFTVWVLP